MSSPPALVATSDKPIQSARHVQFPFNLRDPKVNLQEDPARDLLFKIFPGITNVTEGRLRSYLHFTVSELPPTPWPLTVGGIPITIASGLRGRGPLFPRQNLGNPAISICQDFDGRSDDGHGLTDAVFRRLAVEICRELQANLPEIGPLVEVMFTCEATFYVVVGDGTNINALKLKLPGKIAHCWAGYVLDSDIARPTGSKDLEANPSIEPQLLGGGRRRHGTIVGKSIKVEPKGPTHPIEEGRQYVLHNWAFMGQVEGAGNDAVQLHGGTCGSVVWDADGVVGFFRCHIGEGDWAGFSAFVDASEVANANYQLA